LVCPDEVVDGFSENSPQVPEAAELPKVDSLELVRLLFFVQQHVVDVASEETAAFAYTYLLT
jgi:hypothetical protein